LEALAARDDRSADFDYFMDLYGAVQTPEAVSERTGRPVVSLLCIQAPIELIHAAGFHPHKVVSGSQAMANMALQGLPALTCPMLRAVTGAAAAASDGTPGTRRWVLPTTCDWVVKFPEMLESSGAGSIRPSLHWMELPHLKDGDSGQARWLEEVFGLKKFLEGCGGKISRASLDASIRIYRDAWRALTRLAMMRQEGRIAAVWFALIAGAFFLDSPERWTKAALSVNPPPGGARSDERAHVFLAGSPIFFPNFKLLDLLEDSGVSIAADDLCSGERIFPGGVTYRDSSEFGMMSALAQRYHQGCLCPTFIDNDRRINNILSRRMASDFQGVVFHVLKGCHPYDLESLSVEAPLKERGLKFLRLETDYAAEDSQNLRTRIEAFRGTLSRR
jgi:benzoyl-CoA reductase/2-hydroxyglutaryl-CoA dehydratase subunit BcrC/BadD/HgdB